MLDKLRAINAALQRQSLQLMSQIGLEVMMIKHPENRYDIRKNDHDQYWSVFDVLTGDVIEVNDVLLDALEYEEADDIVDLLNGQFIESRKISRQ